MDFLLILIVIPPFVVVVGLLLVAPLITVGVLGTLGVITIRGVRAGGLGLPLRVVAAVVATAIVACRYRGGDNCDQRSEEVEKAGREFHDEGGKGWVGRYYANTTGKDFDGG